MTSSNGSRARGIFEIAMRKFNTMFYVTFILFFGMAIYFFFVPNTTYGKGVINSDNTIRLESINPDMLLIYDAKRLLEKMEYWWVMKFNKDGESNYLLKMTDRRLAELYFVVENSKASELETSSSRYVTFIGFLVNYLSQNKSRSQVIFDSLEKHPEVIIGLRNKYSHETAEWRIVQQAVESAQVLLSKASS